MSVNSCMYCAKDQRLSDLMIEIAELDSAVLYLFKEQTYKGRSLLAFKREHKEELFELSEDELAAFSKDIARAAKAIKLAFNPGKINYGAYGDKMPHLHFHLVPKYEDAPKWGSTFDMQPDEKVFLTEEGYAEIIQKLKERL